MRIKWYQSDIIERFMTEVEQAKFDRKYNESKLVTLGRSGLVRDKYSVPRFRNINCKHEWKEEEDDTCACGGVRLPHSDFCRDCI